MLKNIQIDLPKLVAGFGVLLFLALTCLLRMQQRRQKMGQERLSRGLRNYAANGSGQVTVPVEAGSPASQ